MATQEDRINTLLRDVRARVPLYAAEMLGAEAQDTVLEVLRRLSADRARRIARHLNGHQAWDGGEAPAVPLGLMRLGADPATASTIFLTTVTDVVGMGLMLVLATTLVL